MTTGSFPTRSFQFPHFQIKKKGLGKEIPADRPLLLHMALGTRCRTGVELPGWLTLFYQQELLRSNLPATLYCFEIRL